ncbi:hypothetical protein EMA8858_03584 [Emticicia aquatica]|jgi:uncharacterized protein (TIGR02453 family)|uniref:TIGR02453 family protein n=1 Tax=Emticicia aquatica TaxID=1681835 RepID=A0ABM9AVN8_9BACT|nr:DUF2461 domain-containing protein [Emticicia aquatica]CAH0997451.1 hypothetical protein EMA8858_03584 [Emticicia aquatica]
MLQSQTLQFLKDLKENNNKPWFDANRKTYEAAKKNFGEIVETVIKGIGQFDQSIDEAHLQAKDCTFRINRDVRFSKNKDPYKTNFGASFSKGGKKAHSAGYYLHIDPSECFLAGGIWMPESEDLKKIRTEIDYNFAEFSQILTEESFKKQFPNGLDREAFTVRPPKGYEESNPAIELIKLKSFTVSNHIDSKIILEPNFINYILDGFKALLPYIQFMNRAIDS